MSFIRLWICIICTRGDESAMNNTVLNEMTVFDHVLFIPSGPMTEAPCAIFNEENVGYDKYNTPTACTGRCVPEAECPGENSVIHWLCPDQDGAECCFTSRYSFLNPVYNRAKMLNIT